MYPCINVLMKVGICIRVHVFLRCDTRNLYLYMERRCQPECSAPSNAAVEEVQIDSRMELEADCGMEFKDGGVELQDDKNASATTVNFGVHV